MKWKFEADPETLGFGFIALAVAVGIWFIGGPWLIIAPNVILLIVLIILSALPTLLVFLMLILPLFDPRMWRKVEVPHK
jgi:hypothetical protein